MAHALGRTPPLEAGTLRLEPLRVEDADAMAEVLADDALYDFTGGSPPDVEELRARFTFQVAGPAHKGEAWHNWIVRQGGVPVGYVQATVSSASADVAWVIGLDWQGRGLARAAAAAMCGWLRREGVRELTAHIRPDHSASIGVAEACGLERTELVDDDGERVWRWHT